MRSLHKVYFVLFLVSLALASFGSPQPTHAANFTATQSGFWFSSTTWGGAGVPTANDNVTIPAGIIVETDGTITRNGTTLVNGEFSGEVNFTNNGTMTINGKSEFVTFSITNNGTITMGVGSHVNWASNFTNNTGASINVQGYSVVFSISLNNATGATITVNGFDFAISASFNNNGTLIHTGSNSFYIQQTTNNVGTIENYDTITNSSTINNTGIINNYCQGVIVGNAPVGNPPVDTCPTDTPTYTATFTPTNTPTNTPTLTPSSTACVNSVTAPSLISPSHRSHTTDTTPQFTWSFIANTQSYRVMVYSDDRSFEYKKRVFTTGYTLTTNEALPKGKYQWRVRTQDNTCSTWSAWSGRNTLFVD
jgi:hypothetical protein